MTSTAEPVAPVELELRDARDGRSHRVVVRRLLIAGFTGRERAAVQAHIEELRELGVPVPETTPVFFELPPDLLTTGEEIVVDGDRTSGEVEPVVVVTPGGRLLTVGSDHTDRELEKVGIAEAKLACPKVVATRCVPVERVRDWDTVELRSWLDDAPEPYQDGALGDLMALDDLVDRLDRDGPGLQPGDVLFMGTVPVIGGALRPSGMFTGQLHLPGEGHVLTVSYRVTVEA